MATCEGTPQIQWQSNIGSDIQVRVRILKNALNLIESYPPKPPTVMPKSRVMPPYAHPEITRVLTLVIYGDPVPYLTYHIT